MSSPRSSARTLWVSAPTEMMSTPVAAMSRDRLEGDAAAGLDQRAAADQRDARAQVIEGEVVEHDRVDAARTRAPLDLVEPVDLDLDVRRVRQIGRGLAQRRGDVGRSPRGGCPWPSRHPTASSGGCARRRSARRGARAPAGPAWSCGCRRRARRCPRPPRRTCAVSVAMPVMRCTRLSATRSACSTARAGPSTVASTAPASKRVAVGDVQRDLDRRVERRHRDLEHLGAGEDAGSRATSSASRDGRRRHERLRGEVAERRVLVERHVDDALDLAALKHAATDRRVAGLRRDRSRGSRCGSARRATPCGPGRWRRRRGRRRAGWRPRPTWRR